MNKAILTILVFLTFSAAHAGNLDSTRQARVQVFRNLGLDTAGTSNLSTGSVDYYVRRAVNQVNEDLQAYKRQVSLTTVDGQMMYNVGDSMVNVIALIASNADSTYGLKYIDFDTNSLVWEYDEDGIGYPEYYFKWGDSIGVIPKPRKAGISMRLFYVGLIPTDSLRKLPEVYRDGVVLYATYLAAGNIGIDPVKYLGQYLDFLSRKRGVVQTREK